MKLSKETREVIRLFATLGDSFVFRTGKRQYMLSKSKSYLISADIAEDIPVEAGIINLKKFSDCLDAFDDPDVEFKQNCISIGDLESEVNFALAEGSISPAKTIKFIDNGIYFKIKSSTIKKIVRYCKITDCKKLDVKSTGGAAFLRAQPNPTSSDKFKLKLGECSREFSFSMHIDGLKFLEVDYDISISDNGIIKFNAASESLYYLVALNSVIYKN